jgi:phenylpropionate dioxygenase-like ring-hydroxylating dioxygenase large terminal subunit
VSDPTASAPGTRTWVPLAPVDRIPPGVITSLALAGRELVAWRDRSGRICVADGICPHRGAHLGGGAVVDGELICPLHGWRFDGQGANVFRPDGLPLSSSRLSCYPVTECVGMLLIDTSALWWWRPEPTPGCAP